MAARAATDRSTGTPHPSRLGDVVDVMLDRGVIVDFYTRVIFTDLEVATVDGRFVIASLDTYLRFAEAVGRPGTAAATGKETAHSLTA